MSNDNTNKPSPIDAKEDRIDAAAQLCAHGVLNKISQTVGHFDDKLKVVTERQVDISDKISAENEKFSKCNDQFRLQDMIDTTAHYHDKLVSPTTLVQLQ